MRVGDYVENFTTESARRAVKELTALAAQTVRVEQLGLEIEVPLGASAERYSEHPLAEVLSAPPDDRHRSRESQSGVDNVIILNTRLS